jgi:hypothetical protein
MVPSLKLFEYKWTNFGAYFLETAEYELNMTASFDKLMCVCGVRYHRCIDVWFSVVWKEDQWSPFDTCMDRTVFQFCLITKIYIFFW